MKKLYLLLFYIIGIPVLSFANHLYGGELFYTHTSGLSYKVTMSLYGDCNSSNPQAFNLLFTASPKIKVMRGTSPVDTLTLLPDAGSGVEVTPVCPANVSNTACNGGTLPGVRKFVYSVNVTLPSTSSDWHFIFEGDLGNNSVAGRSSNITNINLSGTSLMYLDILLNNSNGANSSTQFTTIPTPFYCINTQQQYNQGAIDPDNDSLYFNLEDALTNGNPAVYNIGYSGIAPLSTQPNNFLFNNLNGQLSFTPDIVQNSLVVNKVYEYRNGTLVGSAVREMSFIVLGNCQNTPPQDSIDNTTLVGAALDTNNNFHVCEGQTSLSFNAIMSDPDGDALNVTAVGLPAGATLNVQNNNTINPLIIFNWNTTNVPAGIYNFFVNIKDDHCPINSQQTRGYTVIVTKPNQLNAAIIAETQCIHQAAYQLNISNGTLPRTVTIKQGATVVKTFTDNTGIITDSLPTGSYTIEVSSPYLPCTTSYVLTVADGGTYPNQPIVTKNIYYCKDDVPTILQASADPGAVVRWYDIASSPLPGAPTPNTTTAGIYQWLVSQQFNVCESLKDTVTVFVTTKPIANFQIPESLCELDTLQVSFTGTAGTNAIYSWDWNGGIVVSGQGNGPYDIYWNSNGVKTIKLIINENQCFSDELIKQITIKPTPIAEFSVLNACEREQVTFTYNADVLSNATYSWTFDQGTPSASNGLGPHYVLWDTSGKKLITLITDLDGCSDSIQRLIDVYPKPEVAIINKPETVCLGDRILLQYSGADTYNWLPKDKIFYEPDSTPFIRVYEPSTYTLIGSSAFGCNDTASLTYSKVEPCCNFSYPNVFTPNNDGRNDTWRPLMYGNHAYYELVIYNRWGQQLFHSFIPTQSWDGMMDGSPCEPGSYFYRLKAKCLTGYSTEEKGDFILLR